MNRNLIAFDDSALIDWLLELIEQASPRFLSFLAEAAILADPEEYATLRPGLLLLKQKHLRIPVTSGTNDRSRPSPRV